VRERNGMCEIGINAILRLVWTFDEAECEV
jgi:hypothetical protein